MHYKLTNQNMQTYNSFQWEQDRWRYIDDANLKGELCTDSWFHCYDSKLLAVLFNPVHACISNPRLFECHVQGMKKVEGGDKLGFTEMMLGAELELPLISRNQKIAFGILCVRQVYQKKIWTVWADGWLNGNRCDDSKVVWDKVDFVARHAIEATMTKECSVSASVAARAARNASSNAFCSGDILNLKDLANEAMQY